MGEDNYYDGGFFAHKNQDYRVLDEYDDELGFEDYEQTTVNPGKWLLAGTVGLCLLILLIPLALLYLKRRRKRKAAKKKLVTASSDIWQQEDGDDDSNTSESMHLSTFIPIVRSPSYVRARRMNEWNNLAEPIILAVTKSRVEMAVPLGECGDTSRTTSSDFGIKKGIPTDKQSDETSITSERSRFPTFEAIFRNHAYREAKEAKRKKEKDIADLMALAAGEQKAKRGRKWWQTKNRKKAITGQQHDLSKELIDAVTDADDAPEDIVIDPPPSAKESLQYCLALPRRDSEMKKILKLAIPYTIASLIESLFDLLTLAVIGNLLGTASLEAYVVVYFALELSTMFLEGLLTSLTTVCSQAVGAGRYKLAGQYTQIAAFLYELLLLPQIVLWYLYFSDLMLWFGFDQEVAEIGQAYINVYVFIYVIEAVHHAFHFLLEVNGHEKFMAVADGLHHLVCFSVVLGVAWYSEPSLQTIGFILLGVHFIMISNEFVYVFGCTTWMEHYAPGILGGFAFSNARAVKVFLQTAIPQSIGYVLSYGEWQILFVLASALGPAEVAAWGIIGEVWDTLENLTLAWGDAAEVRCGHLLGAGNPTRASLSAHKSLLLGTFYAVVASGILISIMDYLPLLFTQDTTLQRMVREAIPFVAVANVALGIETLSWQLVGSQARYGVATVVQCIGSWFVAIPLSVVSCYILNWDLRGMVAAVALGCIVSGSLNLAIVLMTKWEKASARVMRKTSKGLEDEEDEFSITDPVLPDYSEAAAGLFVDVPDEDSTGRSDGLMKVPVDGLIKAPDEFTTGRSDGLMRDITDPPGETPMRSGLLDGTNNAPPAEEPTPEEGYNDYDWDELPDNIRKAAAVCGFNRRIWNADGVTKYDEYDWEELPPKVQKAAAVLGYEEEKWDNED